jgi:hypothetical protein
VIDHIVILFVLALVAYVFWRAGYITGQAQRDLQWRQDVSRLSDTVKSLTDVPGGTHTGLLMTDKHCTDEACWCRQGVRPPKGTRAVDYNGRDGNGYQPLPGGTQPPETGHRMECGCDDCR